MKDFIAFLSKNQAEVLRAFGQHIWLVVISVGIGFIIALPAGIILSRHKRAAKYIIAFTGTLQTIPSLVLLGLARLLFGIGALPAIMVLAIYAILPILRNTYTGIDEVDPSYVEAARGIGMTDAQVLMQVELPLAIASIVGGLRMSVIYIISWATLAGLIGAGGLGDLIWTGLGTYSRHHIYAGAIPAALLALIASFLIGLLQNALTPRGIRREASAK
ncbi:MAG: ABC transporter permease [Christensenellales bacterium]